MKNIRKLFILLFLGTIVITSINAQLKEVEFIKGGMEDAEVLFTDYLAPWANAFGANLNAGWYNTAKPHKLGGFDVTISFNTSWAPPSAKTMDLSSLGLEALIGNGTNGTISPTIAGKKVNERPVLSYVVDNPVNPANPVTIAEYEMPNGTGLNLVPLPMIQASIGLPLGTEVTGRFLPNLSIGDIGNVGLWGVGLKHDIFQHIPVLKKLPVLNASLQGGYTKLNTYSSVNFTPDDAYALNLVTDMLMFKDQKINLGVQAYTVNLVLSQTLPVVTFYQAIGYSTTKTGVALTGNYPFSRLETDIQSPYFGQVVVEDEDIIKDPMDIEIENTKDLRLNAGIRFKLGVLTIHFDYTKANYSLVTGGIGISFR